MNPDTKASLKIFDQKVWRAVGILTLTIILLWIFKATIQVLLLLLTAALVALFFQGLAGLIHGKSGWRGGFCVVVSVRGILLLMGFFFWFMGAKVKSQVEELADTLPASVENAKTQ